MNKNFTSTVAGASILITAVGLIGKGLGLVREIVFANFFGLNTQYDLYLVGAVFPLTINSIILYLAQNYFIPNYNRIKVEKPEGSQMFANTTFWFFTFWGIIFSFVLFYFSKFIISIYLQPHSFTGFESTLNVFRIFLLTIPLNASIAVLAAFLQAEFEFKSPAYSQLLLNVAIIMLVVFFSDKEGVYTIPIGYVIGNLLQLFFLLIKTGSKIKFSLTEFFRKKDSLFLINYSFVLTILIESISQIYLLADRYFFDSVQKGGIASLNYAMNIFLLPVTIFSVALSTAIFPKFSRSFNAKLKDDLQKTLNNFYTINLFLFIPISVALFFYGDLIIRILFQHGEFNHDATMMTFDVLKYYALSLIFYSSYAVINKLMYSANLVRSLLVITVLGCSLKVVMNFIMVGIYQQNGLAISTTISYLFFFLSAAILTAYKLNLSNKHFVKEFLFCSANSLFSFLIANILITGNITNSFLINGLLKLITFTLIYAVNSIISKHNSVKLFSNILQSFSKNNIRAV
ncbi:MAG: lipid II flippase MurJ [Ignavibacteriaceae bacterium]